MKIALITILVLCTSLSAMSQIRQVAEMNTEQIKALDKSKTAVILTGGIIEEHGPFLPTFSDGYWNERVAKDLANEIAKRPGWTVLMFPTIPLGNGGANEIGGKFSFPGTYAVRFETLRSVFMDLAGELGEQKFKWVFIVHGHGAPNHIRALDQASDYFNETYGGTMVNLTGLRSVMVAWNGQKSDTERAQDSIVQHANLDETSAMLALRPDLVDPGYKKAPPLPGTKIEDIVAHASRPKWPGYLGAPALASAERYVVGYGAAAREAVNAAMNILGGADPRKMERFMGDNPVGSETNDPALGNDMKVKQQQSEWLRKKNL